jgi:acyl-CoA thioesterase-1
VSVAIVVLAACGTTETNAPAPPGAEQARNSWPAAAPDVPDTRPVVVAFGDSLTAGQRVGRSETYPAFLQREFDKRGMSLRVVNEGISGDTTAVALSRIDVAIAHQPKWVVLALGANDGLRGLPLDAMERNLREIIGLFGKAGAKVVLAGMKLPRNYGPEYVRDFDGVYPRLAEELDLPLIPFLLENVAMVPELNNADGIHPNAKGNEIIARQVATAFEDFLAD